MITLHHEKETDFSKNGYGVLDDYVLEDEGGSWELNGEFKIALELPAITKFTEHVKEHNIIQAPVPFMDRQRFRIYFVDKTLNSIIVEARHIFYDLLDNWIEDTNIVGQNGHRAIQQLLNNTQYPHPFTGSSNINGTANARMVRMNPVEAVLDDGKANTFISRWGGELVRNNHRIEMLRRRGSDKGVTIQHRKDLLGYNASVDTSTIVTRIQPVGFDGLMLPERYIDSPKMDPSHPVIAEIAYRDVKAAIGENEDDEDAIPLEEAYEELRRLAREEFEINNADEPETVVNVDFVALHNTEQYKDYAQLQEVHAGDTVRVEAPEHEFEITSRLVAFEWSLLRKNHYTSTTLGNHVYEFTSSSTQIDDLRGELEENKQQTIVAIRSANQRNTNYYGPVHPDEADIDPDIGDLYYWENGEETTFFIYTEEDGETYWREVVSTAVNNEIDRRLKEAQEAAEEAQAEATRAYTRVQKAIDDAEEAYSYADSAIREANGKNTVYRGVSKPTEGVENDIWFQYTVQNGDNVTRMHIHDGNDYVLRADDASMLGGTLDLSNLNVINLNMDSATGGSLHLDRGLKVENNGKDVLKVENGNVTMELDNLLIKSESIDGVIGTAIYQDNLAVGLLYEENGVIKSIISAGENGPYIAGNNIVLDGDTIVNGSFTVTDEVFAENMSIDKFTTGTLNAAEVNIINMNADNISTGKISSHVLENTGIATFTDVDDKINGINMDSRNLLKDSRRHISKTGAYWMHTWDITEAIETGEIVTLTWKGSSGDLEQHFGFWNSGGMKSILPRVKPTATGAREYSITFEWDNNGTTDGTTPIDKNDLSLRLYNWPSGTTHNMQIHWIKLERGDKFSGYSLAPEDSATKEELATDSQTIIHGGNITTGSIKDRNGNTVFDLSNGNLEFNHSDNSYTRIGRNGLQRFTSSDNRHYHYLLDIQTFTYGDSSDSARWLQLPSDFKGKNFKVYFAIADSLNAYNYQHAIQRFVCTQHPRHSIDRANARVPVIAYKSETLSDGAAPKLRNVQGMMIAIY